MTKNSLTITFSTLASCTKSTQDEILRVLLETPAEDLPRNRPPMRALDEDEHFAEFSPGQAREFYNGCGEKTQKAIEVMARSETNEFHIADVAKALDVDPSDLRGVWGGLTRRTQTVMDDKSAYLINWELHDAIWDDDDQLVDHIGVITELTHQSFRRLLVK
jgi:hypothetical protein